jgi:hypothetical protein
MALAVLETPDTPAKPARRHARRSKSSGLPLTAAVLSLISSLVLLVVVRVLLPAHQNLSRVLTTWDAKWYERIALHGYSWNPHSPSQQDVAFFPLYPLFERAGHFLTGLSVPTVAIGSSVVFQAGAAAVLVLIVRAQGASDRQTLLWLTLFLLSPPVVFDIMGYYSAQFCLLCLLALWFAQRRQQWLAAVALGLATAANPIGVALAVAFIGWSLVDLLSSGTITLRRVAAVAGRALVSISGIAGYAIFLFVRFGDPLAFYRAESAWTRPVPVSTLLGRVVTFEPVRSSVTRWVATPYGWNTSFFIDAVAALLGVALIIAFVASKGGVRSLGFWFIVFTFLLVQVQSARFGSELGATRLLLPVAFGVGAIEPVRRSLTRPGGFAVTALVLLFGTVIFVRHLAVGQWID